MLSFTVKHSIKQSSQGSRISYDLSGKGDRYSCSRGLSPLFQNSNVQIPISETTQIVSEYYAVCTIQIIQRASLLQFQQNVYNLFYIYSVIKLGMQHRLNARPYYVKIIICTAVEAAGPMISLQIRNDCKRILKPRSSQVFQFASRLFLTNQNAQLGSSAF